MLEEKIKRELEKFDEKFGKCTLSLCDEHEKMQCQRCKFKQFLSSSLRKIAEESVEEIIEEINKERNKKINGEWKHNKKVRNSFNISRK